jgi:hypothetical protein
MWRFGMTDGKSSDEKPKVQIGPSGVSRVEPADILRSKIGQAEINKTATLSLILGLTKPQVNRSDKSR